MKINRTTAFLFLLFLSICSCLCSILLGVGSVIAENYSFQSLSSYSDSILLLFSWGEGISLNLATDFFGTAFALLLLDIIISGREKRRENELQERLLREQLILQAGINDNALALLALRRLKSMGALFDGTLQGRDFSGSNWNGAELEGAQLKKCNLQNVQLVNARLDGANLEGAILRSVKADNANFTSANLTGAELLDASLISASMSWTDLTNTIMLTEQQLLTLSMLWGAIMPDGKRYDGHFDLDGDIAEAHKNKINYADSSARKQFYNVDNN